MCCLPVQETCPYQNEKLSRKRREADTEDTSDSLLLTRLRNDFMRNFVSKVTDFSFRRQSVYGRRYYDDIYNDRNRYYDSDRYYGRDRYDDRYDDRYYGRNYRGRAGFDNCGR